MLEGVILLCNVKKLIEGIQWPEPPLLEDLERWNDNREVVRMLCCYAEIIHWYNGKVDKDIYLRIPDKYFIRSVCIEFLPHWSYYRVGGIELSIPESMDDVFKAITKVEELKLMGYKPP